MFSARTTSAGLALVLTLALPGGALAQDEAPPSPEGPEWVLTSYYDEDAADLVPVPFPVRATLSLQDGTASGSAGCNQFSGGYQIDGGALSFSEEMIRTLALCDEPQQGVEDAYLAALNDVAGWLIDGETLELSDGIGDVILTFEQPSITWTTSQMTSLMTTLSELRTGIDEMQTGLETLRSDMEGQNVPKLRQRIKALETKGKDLDKRVSTLEKGAGSGSSGGNGSTGTVSFTSAEKLLLEGIPSRIADRCRPLRSSLPKSTRAAVTCAPNTKLIDSADYYLMNGADAAAEFGSVMTQFNVPLANDGASCAEGVKSQRQAFGSGWRAEGCYRTNGRAEVRFIDNAAGCRKLKVAGKTLRDPAVYIALQGTDNDAKAVYEWATRNIPQGSDQVTSIAQPIPSDLGTAISCPA